MLTRRAFVKTGAGAAAGFFIQTPPARRQVSIGRRRIKVVDIHGHLSVPEVRVVKGTNLATSGGDQADGGGLSTASMWRIRGRQASTSRFFRPPRLPGVYDPCVSNTPTWRGPGV